MTETTTHPYEQGYLAGQRHRDAGGTLHAGTFDHVTARPYDQGYVDGFMQRQGRLYAEQQIDDWKSIFGASAEMWSWWRWIEFLDGDWDKPCSVILHIEDPDDETKVVGHLRHPEEIFAALATATELYPWHFVRHCGELDLDASSADVVLQVAALGDVVYG
jgi:hypothetical protein